MKEIERIQMFSDAFGPSGFEDDIVALIRKETDETYDIKEDHMRNLYMTSKNRKTDGIRIHLDAHSDEVGFIVQAVKPNGTLRFLPLGGWDVKNIIGQKVMIKNKDGNYIPGIVSSKPVHFMNESERKKSLDFEDLLIDIGANNAQEVQESYRIGIGSPVAPDVVCSYDEKHGIFMGKAMDCRIGCAALIETLHRCQTYSISATCTSQEEVGERGMKCAIGNINCDVMICFEGCPADDTFEEDYMIQSAIRKGPMLRHFDCSMITNPRFQAKALKIAEKHHIPVQESVRKGGGTNGGISHVAYEGIPTIVIGIPVRYAHSTYGISSYEDYRNAVELACCIIEELTIEDVQQF